MRKTTDKTAKSSRGASLVEYGMITGLISVLSIGAVVSVGEEVEYTFCVATSSIASALGKDGFECDLSLVGGGNGTGSGTEVSWEDDVPGGGNGVWDSDDTIPNEFFFEDSTGLNPNVEVTSGSVTMEGLSEPVRIWTIGHTRFSINGGEELSEGTISNGDVLRLHKTSPDGYSEASSAYVRVGGYQARWMLRTHQGDISPDDFALTDVFGVAPTYPTWSEPFRLSGVNTEIFTSASSYAYWYRLSEDGSSRSLLRDNSPVNEGDILQVNGIAAPQLDTARAFDLTLGGAEATWTVTTQAQYDTPSFDFVDVSDIDHTNLVESNEVTVSGLTTPQKFFFLTNTNSYTGAYINGEKFEDLDTYAEWVDNGDKIKLFGRFTNTRNFGSTLTHEVQLAGITDERNLTFTDGEQSVTMANLGRSYGDPNTYVEITRVVSGFSGLAIVSEVDVSSLFSLKINGAPASATDSIQNGDTITFRARFNGVPNAVQTEVIKIGDANFEWDLETNPQTLREITGLESNYTEATGNYAAIPFNFEGGNYKSYITVTTSWGGSGSLKLKKSGTNYSGGIASPREVSTSMIGADLLFSARDQSVNGTVTITMHDKSTLEASTMSQSYSVSVNVAQVPQD